MLFDWPRAPVFADLIEKTQRSRNYFMFLAAFRADHCVPALEPALGILRMDDHVGPAGTGHPKLNEFVFHSPGPPMRRRKCTSLLSPCPTPYKRNTWDSRASLTDNSLNIIDLQRKKRVPKCPKAWDSGTLEL